MKRNTLLREIAVIIGVASLLGLAYNLIPGVSPKQIALIREEQVLEQISDSDLFGPSSSATPATPVQPEAQPQVAVNQTPAQTQVQTNDIATSTKTNPTQAPTQAPKTSSASTNTPPAPQVKTPDKIKPNIITYQQVLRLLEDKDVLFIDARNDDEWAEGHIPGAIHIFAEDFQKHVPEVIGLPRDKRIVVYCGGGPECTLSHEVCDNLASFGFNRLFIYMGGWTEWKKMKAEGK